MIEFVKERLWDSFIDSSAEILKQVQVLAVSKMKNDLKSPSRDLSQRSGNLARDVQGQIETQFAPGTMVFSRRKMTAPNAHLLVEGKYPVTDRQKRFFYGLSERTRKAAGGHTPLSRLYFNMSRIGRPATIFGRPLIEQAMNEVDWIKTVKKNIQSKVPNKTTRINIG